MNPLHLSVGILLGIILSPVFLFIFWTLVVPLALFLAALAAAAFAYAKFKLKCNKNDWIFLSGAIVPRIQQIIAARRNYLTDDYWYWRYNQTDKDAPFIITAEDGSVWTWADMENFSNRVAHWALAQKWPVNTTVGLYMPNRPEFVGFWLGLTKVGIRIALLNFNLRNVALTHCIKTGECKALIFDGALTDCVSEVLSDLNELKVPLFAYDATQEQANSVNATALASVLETSSILAVAPAFRASARGAKIDEPFAYIYTSGTTGLPKAGKVSHFRFRLAGGTFAGIYRWTPQDRVYCSLPLYHSAGGMIGIGGAIQSGATVILRKKFSASNFAPDCKKYKVTIMQYIGELCRYLLATPALPEDKQLNIRLAVGNGMRPDVWLPFKHRFGIKQIGEFYAATEGASALINVGDVDHSIGYNSPLLGIIAPACIVKYNQDTDEIVRGPDGRVVLCKPGEPGEFIAKIKRSFGVSNYSGYTDKNASEKKVLHNAFVDGDSWFRSGDLLKQDENRNVFFVDRVGDTFRWKGENCATSEVSQVMGMFPSLPEANVYGVEVPHADGRAGMAAISGVANPKNFDFKGLVQHLNKNLPKYAIPLFLRFMPGEIGTTSTFKHLKGDLRKEGFSSSVKDPLYFFDGKMYVPLTDDIRQGLESGKIRV